MTEAIKDREAIGSAPCPQCPICGSPGEPFQQGLTDVFFHSPGAWDSKKCVNPECRTVWLDPMPLEEDIHKAYQDYLISRQVNTDNRDEPRGFFDSVRQAYLASRYGYGRAGAAQKLIAAAVRLHPGWRGSLDVGVFYLKHVAGGRLLEVGCGAGRQLKLMQDLGWQAEGVDADPEVAAKAREKGLEVSAGYVYDQGFPDDSFDAIVLNHMIEHVYELDRFLAELYRILKPGGQLVVVTPNIESLGSRMYKHFIVSFMDTPRHLYVFTEGTLRQLAQRAGFRDACIFSTPRHAGFIYMSNQAIERTGYYMIPYRPPLRDRLGALAAIYREAAAIRSGRRFAGEELVLIGSK